MEGPERLGSVTIKMTAQIRAAVRDVAARPWLTDVAIGGGLTVLHLSILSGDPAPPAAVLLALLQTLPLVGRRHRPWTVLVVIAAAAFVYRTTEPDPGKTPAPLFLLFAVYAVARYAPSPRSLAAVVIAGTVPLTAEITIHRSAGGWIGVTTLFGMPAVAWVLGTGRRRIQSDADRLRDLTHRLHAEQEINARQVVQAERTRIARDLHDMVAHHVSAIAVQAHSTQEVLDDDPRLGRAGLARISATADTALTEMRRILGLLTPQEEELAPEPSLCHLDRLVRAAESTGCRVTAVLDESITTVPPAVQVSAYRIVQEALTNVLKHAGPTGVQMDVRHNEGVLTIDVQNSPPAPSHRPIPGSGRGLVGIRERVAAFGGTLRTGPLPSGGWHLQATLPLTERP